MALEIIIIHSNKNSKIFVKQSKLKTLLFSLSIFCNKFRFYVVSPFFHAIRLLLAREHYGRIIVENHRAWEVLSSVRQIRRCVCHHLLEENLITRLSCRLDWRKSPLCLCPCLLFVARQLMKNPRSHDSFISPWSMAHLLSGFSQNKKIIILSFTFKKLYIVKDVLCGKFSAGIYARI